MIARKSLSLLVSALFLGSAVVSCGPSGEPAPPATGEEAARASADEPAAHEEAPAPSGSQQGTDLAKWGEPLDRPERYYGVYASPNSPDREWFVKAAKRPIWAERAPKIPPGHLAVGAMFGDVAPWNMKTLSDTEFVQTEVSPAQPEPVRVEFELGEDGRAVAFSFTNEQSAAEGRLVRQGDLPADWQ